MKAFQVWLVARDAATLDEIARALLTESDDRKNCETYNEALSVADKVNFARSSFGRDVFSRQPIYVALTLPAVSFGMPHLPVPAQVFCECASFTESTGGRCPNCGRPRK